MSQQPKLEVFLKNNPRSTAKDYITKYIGDYKGHHRKIKRAFNKSTTKFKDNQVDWHFAKLILSGQF